MSRPRARKSASLLVSFAAKVVLLLASTAVVLLAFELGLRATGHQAIYEIYSKPWIFWQYDPLLGWSHQPGVEGEYVGPRPWPIEFRAQVSINELGLRGPEVGPRAPAEIRVLFLGDSMVAAFEVSYEETFVARVQETLARRLSRPVRAINAGVRGYGSDQSYLYYRERGRLLEPDVVVLFASRNDPVDNTTVHEMRRPFGKPALSLASDGSLSLLGHPVPTYPVCSEYQLAPTFEIERKDGMLTRWMCRGQLALFDRSALFSFLTVSIPWDISVLRGLYNLGNPHADRPVRGGEAESAENFAERLATAIVVRLAREVVRDGAMFVLIGRPVDLEPLDVDRVAAVQTLVVSLDDVWSAPPLEVRWQHDSHFNANGHRIVAEELVPRLEKALREDAARGAAPNRVE